MKKKIRIRIYKSSRLFKNGMTPSQMSNELKILMIEGKTLEEIADLIGYKVNSISKLISKLGLKNPYRTSRKKKKLSYEEVITKLNAMRGLEGLENQTRNLNWQRKWY